MHISATRITLLTILLATCALAENKDKEAPFEVFGGFSYLREGGANFPGWTGTFVAEIAHGFGIAADFDGHYHSATEGSIKVSEHEHGFTFGPHYAYRNSSRVTPIFFAVFGGVHSSVSAEREHFSANGFAANVGGGLDVKVSESVGVRLIQIDAAYTRIHGGSNTSPRISAGLVFHFGK